MALAKGTPRKELSGVAQSQALQAYGMLDNVKIYVGSAVVLDTSGRAKVATATTGQVAIGVAVPGMGAQADLDTYDNTVTGHADNFVTVYAAEGIFKFTNDGTNPVLSTTQPGTKLYFVDDDTVSVLSTGRSPAGRLVKLDSVDSKVAVEVSRSINASILGI